MHFQSQRIAITGGSSGIGKAIAQIVINEGGEVILMGRTASKLQEAVEQLGAKATYFVLDVTNEQAVAKTFDKIGAIDHLITAAAGTARGKVVDLPVAEAKALFESKYWGQYHCVKYAIPHLQNTGSIVLFSGWISRKPMAGVSTLAAIDGAIESLAKTLALELAPIRVNAITPGMIDTPLWRARLSEEEQAAHFKKIGDNLPVGRAGTAEDVAHAVIFLMQNGFTTGAILDVDGGQR